MASCSISHSTLCNIPSIQFPPIWFGLLVDFYSHRSRRRFLPSTSVRSKAHERNLTFGTKCTDRKQNVNEPRPKCQKELKNLQVKRQTLKTRHSAKGGRKQKRFRYMDEHGKKGSFFESHNRFRSNREGKMIRYEKHTWKTSAFALFMVSQRAFAVISSSFFSAIVRRRQISARQIVN